MTYRALPFLAAALSLSASAFAQSGGQQGGDKSAFYQSGPWTVIEHRSSRMCRLTRAGLPNGTFTLSKADAEPAYFDYEPKPKLDYYAPKTGVEWRFDDVVIEGRLLTGQYYQIEDKEWRTRAQSALAEDRFRRADKLAISQNGETVVEIDLAGSLKAFDQLVRCAAQWPGARMLLAPPPAPPRLQR